MVGKVSLLSLLLFVNRVLLVATLHFSDGDQAAVARLRGYLRFETVHPSPNYYPVVEFLVEQAEQLGLQSKVLEYVRGKPLVLMSWAGTEPSLPSVLLNSHTDVVPVEVDKWKHPPFAASMDEDGNIYARGAQDMKSLGMVYLEAIRNLKASGFKPRRSVHVSFVPDEEVGGDAGARRFYESQEFEDLNVGVVLDESVPSEDHKYLVSYGEKANWWFCITAMGQPGHGSRLLDGMALENLRISLDLIAEFRAAEFEKVKSGEKALGEVISINNVYLTAGTSTPNGFVMNIQPSVAEAGFDMRIPPTVDSVAAIQRLVEEEWAPESRNLTHRFIRQGKVLNSHGQPLLTAVDDSNPWWGLLKGAVEIAGGSLADPIILPGGTDGRYARERGIPTLGFSPFSNTPISLHEHNEFLNAGEFLKGIKVYEKILQSFLGQSFESPGSQASDNSELSSNLVHTEL